MPYRAIVLVLAVAACGGGSEEPSRPPTFGGDRPADLKAPVPLTEGKRYPLYLVLHGFGATGFVQSAYFGVTGIPAADQGFVIAPDGTPNGTGKQFWNADAECCDFENQNPDDVAYLGTILDDILDSDWPVDPARVYVLGHSNGGFMAYRMACDRADVIAAIGSLAGLASSTPATCQPARGVHVLQMHGTADAVVPYATGGSGIGTVGAEGSVTQWGTHNGCATTRTMGAPLDIDTAVAGVETQRFTVDGCPADGSVELWKMEGSSHIPTFGPSFTQTLLQWFNDHPRS
jgi:polyhydroxybutyrate depolymerase